MGVYVLRNFDYDSYPINRFDTLKLFSNNSFESIAFRGGVFEIKVVAGKESVLLNSVDGNYTFEISRKVSSNPRLIVNHDNGLFYERID